MKRQGALAIVLCHVWFVNSYVSPPANPRIRRTETGASLAPSILAQQRQSAVVVLQGADGIQQQQQPNITDRLWTYAYNIPKASRQHGSSKKTRTKPVYSLMYFLRDQIPLNVEDASIEEALERATIQAVRSASAVGDYRLIFRVVETAIDYAAQQQQHSILPARLFGEAIESLARTSCNISKLKQMWKLAKNSISLIKEPGLGAFELNVMLKALAGRGKIRAALDLYQAERDAIEGDAYTMSTLLMALTSSISDSQTPLVDKDKNAMSPCWQYNEGRRLLDSCSFHQLNNFVFAAALRLNERAGQVFDAPNQRHYSAKSAMDILQLMKKLNISPDVVTCTLVASAFDKAHQSKAAVALLDAMMKQGGTPSWKLPAPNEYVYSSVISACARCNEYDAALQVLERMRKDETCNVNTWVYNAALTACVGAVSRRSRKKQSQMALTLMNEMQQDYERGMNTAPDSVSYNTALAAIDGMGAMYHNQGGQLFSSPVHFEVTEEFSAQEAAAFELVQRMKDNSIPRDALTYRNAIKAARTNANAVLSMLDVAIDDLNRTEEMIYVFHSALSVLSSGDYLIPVATVFSKIVDCDVQTKPETVIYLLNALGNSGNSEFIPNVLLGLDGDATSLDMIKQHCDINVEELFLGDSNPSPNLKHYSAAIKACLTVNDIDNALSVLSLMRVNSLSPDSETLQEIALTYCRLANIASAEESKIGRRARSNKKKKRTLQMDVKRSVSAARARSALDITLSLGNPSTHLLSTVPKACCSAGMWAEGRMLLGRVHNAAVMTDGPSEELFHAERSNDPMAILPGLHRSLLKHCASKGNATAALGFVDDIQALSKTLSSSSDETCNDEVSLSSIFQNDESTDDDIDDVSVLVSEVANIGSAADIGMKGEDWKLLLIAASKAGHWRLCLGTLQFLKPFLEATHPSKKSDSNRKWHSKRYDKLARSLTAAILCFEMRGQYAWAIRAIEDWIEWSGRRPRKEAVLGAFRILASRGQGYEVNRLLKRVLDVPATSFEDSQAASYEEILCTGALNSLHLHGLYEDADVLYVQACTQGHLPFSIESSFDAAISSQFVLDLHGMNVAMAHSAVRIALQQYALPASPQEGGDMVIVTGRGMNSAQRLRPVLRPEVQRMLLEEFYPPLSTTSIPGNMGALRVPSQDVNDWVFEQRQQKGARMLAIADVLKNLTSGERIRKSIELSLQWDDEQEK